MCLLSEWSFRTSLKLENIAANLNINEQASDCRPKRKSCCEQSDIPVRHNHLQVVIKQLEFVPLQFPQFLCNNAVLNIYLIVSTFVVNCFFKRQFLL